MDPVSRIEAALDAALSDVERAGCPPRLSEVLRYSVFPGGARIRPRLTLAVNFACGSDNLLIADSAAAAIEFLHCGSLVHDDLPCFDDADLRRGKPSVHRAYGESLAVLAGDALISLAFETVIATQAKKPKRIGPLLKILGSAVGAGGGIIAGQAWECESAVDLAAYHRAKTASLFSAATMAGAAAAGVPHEPWRALGEQIGEAFQVADDIGDHVSSSEEIGKPVGQDAALGRPSAVASLGLDGAVARLKELVRGAVLAIPLCPGEAHLRAVILNETQRFLPAGMVRHAA